jgi:hypothetical protein
MRCSRRLQPAHLWYSRTLKGAATDGLQISQAVHSPDPEKDSG